MIKTGVVHEGLEIYLSNHANERVVERVYGGTTRNVIALTCALIEGSTISVAQPDFLDSESHSRDGTPSCWLVHDKAGVQFAMPLHYLEVRGRQSLCATTCLIPSYKSRRPKEAKASKKTKLRKHKIGGRGNAPISSPNRIAGRSAAAKTTITWRQD